MISTLKKKLNKKGFTLAELLVVVAIIAVLVAIAIPVFGGALGKANHAADLANVRASYAEELVKAMTANDFGKNGTATATVNLTTVAKSMKNASSKLSADTSNHTITVTLDTYTGSFNYDDDVSFVTGDPSNPSSIIAYVSGKTINNAGTIE